MVLVLSLASRLIHYACSLWSLKMAGQEGSCGRAAGGELQIGRQAVH